MADLKEESHPHLIRREMLNMIKKPGFITFQFYIHRRYFYLKKGKKKRKERRGKKKKKVCPAYFLWKTVWMTGKLVLFKSHKHQKCFNT